MGRDKFQSCSIIRQRRHSRVAFLGSDTMSHHHLFKKLVLVALLIWGCSGCYVPLDQPDRNSREYYPAVRKDFTPGETTRAEVLLKMGEPDEHSADETVLTYRWGKSKGFISMGNDPWERLMDFGEKTTFSFKFDKEGVLESLDISILEYRW